jgi:hypothetical protein
VPLFNGMSRALKNILNKRKTLWLFFVPQIKGKLQNLKSVSGNGRNKKNRKRIKK